MGSQLVLGLKTCFKIIHQFLCTTESILLARENSGRIGVLNRSVGKELETSQLLLLGGNSPTPYWTAGYMSYFSREGNSTLVTHTNIC